MIDVKVIMNSCMEEVLGFKCCGVLDQNLEMHVHNLSDRPLVILGRCILEKEKEILELNLFPPWQQVINPGKAVAFYASVDSVVWRRYETLIVFDRSGGTHRFSTNDITGYGVKQTGNCI